MWLKIKQEGLRSHLPGFQFGTVLHWFVEPQPYVKGGSAVLVLINLDWLPLASGVPANNGSCGHGRVFFLGGGMAVDWL